MALTYRTGSDGKDSALTIEELDNNFRHFTGSHGVTGSFGVKGNVTITGSIYQTGDVLFSDLPTTELLVTGSLWLSGSGAGNASGSKYLMVFNG